MEPIWPIRSVISSKTFLDKTSLDEGGGLGLVFNDQYFHFQTFIVSSSRALPN